MRAIVYVRVSTDAQERDGTSLDTQERACLDYARAAGWTVVDLVRDAASGFSLERPGIETIRAAMRSKTCDVVLAYAVDRLSRHQNHIGVLFDEADSWGVQFEFVTERFEDTAMGRFILAARAFMAEVEREKIAERTMRGKAERARAGKLPQSTGRGLYGYTYNRDTGHREVEATQAAVVRRIYEHYAATRSFSAVANELNDQGVPAFSGGRWHPLTIRNVLTNESYTGRTVYRRTQRVKTRSVRTQKRTTRVVERPESDWIEVEGATPPIVPLDLWQRVEAIIEDPERISRRPESRHYLLSGRARCRVCKSAMIGQTLTAKGKAYRYYRCRHSYDKNSGRQCEARYVSAEQMETHLWDAVRAVLSEPSRVLADGARVTCPPPVAHDDGSRAALMKLQDRERRLVHLFSLGEVDEGIIREQLRGVRAEIATLERERRRHAAPAETVRVDVVGLEAACRHVLNRLAGAEPEMRETILEALRVNVHADNAGAVIEGSLPTLDPSCAPAEAVSHVCAVVNLQIEGISDDGTSACVTSLA